MTVLVAHDGSRFGAELAEMGGVLAEAAGWPLRILHVREPRAREPGSRAAGQGKPPRRMPPHAELLDGDPVETLVAYVARIPVTVVALGLRSDMRTGLGHVAARLLGRLPASLLVARPGMQPLRALRHVLMPLDGRPSTALTPRHVADLLPNAHPDVLGLHITDGHVTAETGRMTAPRMVDQWHYDWPAWRHEFKRRMASGYVANDDCALCVLVGDPGKMVALEARRRRVDLIVATWNRSLQPGRATCLRHLLESSPCPLLLVDKARLRKQWHPLSAGEAGTTARLGAASGPAVHPRVA